MEVVNNRIDIEENEVYDGRDRLGKSPEGEKGQKKIKVIRRW